MHLTEATIESAGPDVQFGTALLRQLAEMERRVVEYRIRKEVVAAICICLVAAFGVVLHGTSRARQAKEMEVQAFRSLAALHRLQAATRALRLKRAPFRLLATQWQRSADGFHGELDRLLLQSHGQPLSSALMTRIEATGDRWRRIDEEHVAVTAVIGEIPGSGLEAQISERGVSATYREQLHEVGAGRRIRLLKRLDGGLRAIDSQVADLGRELTAVALEVQRVSRRYVRLSANGAALVLALALAAGIAVIMWTTGLNERLRVEIDERRATMEALHKSEQSLKAILDSIGDAVLVLSPKGVIIAANPVAETMMGVAPGGACGAHLSERVRFFREAGGRREPVVLEQLAASPKPVPVHGGLELQRADDSVVRVEETVSPLLGAAGEAGGLVLVLRDVTEAYRLEERIRQTQKMESVGKLAGGIAHDFNNMLAGILGFADLLVEQLSHAPALQGYARQIMRASQRAADLTQKLLAFSRKGRLESRCTDMNRLIGDMTRLLQHSIDRRIDLQLSLRAESAMVRGDPGQLQNALLNLALNARDAMPDGGTIRIATDIADRHPSQADPPLGPENAPENALQATPRGWLRIRVSDTGKGIPDHVLPHIFEPFFTTKEVGKGTGLGLAAVYGTVQSHGGTITVESEVDVGTVFTIRLPLADEIAEPAKNPSAEVVCGSGGVLVVEDEAVVQSVVAETLGRLGYRVVVAADGLEALRIYREQRQSIDLVLLDMIMPGMNGHDCFHRLRAINPKLKIIAVTGYSDNQQLSILEKRGIDGVLIKPVRAAELSLTVAKALGGRTETA